MSKIEGSLQELDETGYWLELLCESGVVTEERATPLHNETDELIAIFVTIVRKVKAKNK
ncbi:MAG: four helix bundle protein [Chloroflexi bacterium]|nr:four helix bundle protein [Chloroflexota bacterium]